MMRFAIGVDLGGTSLRVAAVDESGRVLERLSSPVKTLAGRDRVIEQLCESAQVLIAKHGASGNPEATLAGIGAGVPGIIHRETGQLRRSPNLPGWENFPVRDELERRLGARVHLDNDANLAALGEKWLGAGRDVDSMCLITLGTGVGGGLILDGKIWHGFLGMAGEVGHVMVSESGSQCGCVSTGCLETKASATAIVRKARAAIQSSSDSLLSKAVVSGEPLTAALVFRCAQEGDDVARRIYASVGKYLGIALAGLVNTLNLPLYVLGGGVAEAWDAYAPAMFKQLQRSSYIYAEGGTRVVQSQLRGEAGLFGAAHLALVAAQTS
ncbi:MAG: ROK family protein [Acidobacteria bacterium]|nr:ROK family protein [Acidobacteriota bacterium]